MIYVLATLALGLAAAAGTAVVLGLRFGGLKEEIGSLKKDLGEAIGQRQRAEAQLQETSREFATAKTRFEHQLESIRRDVVDLERDLEQCSTPGSRRSRLEALLAKAGDRENGGKPPTLGGQK